MPAGSEHDGGDGALPTGEGQVSLPCTWRPLGPLVAGLIAGAALLVMTVLLWVGFSEETKQAVGPLQRATVVVIIVLGLACLHALGRSRVQARADRLLVVNGYRRHEYEWAQVVAVRLGPGAPWVTLDLADGTTASAMGIQGSDGRRARQAVRELRAVLDDANPPGD